MTAHGRDTLEAAAKAVGLELPAGAQVVGIHRENGMDDLVAVKLEVPAADWAAFLARTPVDPRLFRPGERGLLGPDDGFWDPHQARSLRTAEASLPGARVLNLGYDDSRPGVIVVYLVNHGT